jgi:ParB family transcriptional regulator, chromosome partitioning protein
VPAHDRRALFIGADAYTEAGGHIIRDLFTEDDGGYFEDAALLNLLVTEKLREIAADVLTEGWKWAEVSTDFPHDHGMRRTYPQSIALTGADEARLQEASEHYDALIEGFSSFDEMTDEQRANVEALDTEIDRISAKRSAYDTDVMARGGAFICLGSNGTVRIERGFVKPEDEAQPEGAIGELEQVASEEVDPDEDENGSELDGEDDEDAKCGKPLSESLVRNLTAHRTLGLRLALGEQPDIAMIVLTHAMVSDLFYHGRAKTCLDLRATSEALGSHADGIGDTPAAEALDARHDAWGTHLPTNAEDVWACITTMDGQSRNELLAHCVALTVNAVKLPWDRSVNGQAAAGVLATAVDLDMTRHWTPTNRSYFGRVTKEHIALAVREAVSRQAAESILPMKKVDMAQAAEQLVAGTGWLPALLRTVKASPEIEAAGDDIIVADVVLPEMEISELGMDDGYAIAAE